MTAAKTIHDPLDGVDFEAYAQIFQAPRGKIIKFKNKNGKETNKPLNTITGEPYIGCGLVGDDLVENVLPSLYYNAKVGKPVGLVGPSGTGKTSIGICHIQNFNNTDFETVMKKDDEKIIKSKSRPILRIQNTANILKEEIVGEWNILRMLFADKDAELFTRKFFITRNMSQALSESQGRGILLDEITRAQEESMNVYLQPTRERMVSTEGQCFGECTPSEKRPWFYVISTENEGDVGTIDKPSALQTRFSRVPVDFISPENEEMIIRDSLIGKTDDMSTIDIIAGTMTVGSGVAKEKGIVPCLTEMFRGNGSNPHPLTVAPSIGDTVDLSKIFVEMGVNKNTMKGTDGTKLKNKMAKIALSMLGKNASDASIVERALRVGACNLRLNT